MIARYTREQMGAVWTQQRRMETWLAVELAATDAWAEEGVVPREAATACRSAASFTVEAVEEREKVTDHDVAAFVDVVAESIGARAAGSTTASPRQTSSTPRWRCRSPRPG